MSIRYPAASEPRPIRHRLLRTSILVSVAMSVSLAACVGPRSAAVDPTPTGAIANPSTAEEIDAALAYWDALYAEDPDNRNNSYYYATVLIRLARYEQAHAVLQRATLNYPDDREIMAAYGKTLANLGQFDEALTIIRRAQQPDRPDWRLLSAEAAILDQLGQVALVRQLYAQAIDLAPGEASLLSNLAMSFVLIGDLAYAEELLRQAVVLPTSDSRVRQNLALVVGLQGRFEEAEQIARQELSPAQAEANIAFLRSMLLSPDAWTQLAQGQGSN